MQQLQTFENLTISSNAALTVEIDKAEPEKEVYEYTFLFSLPDAECLPDDARAILLWTLSFVLPNALRAANDVKFTMIVSILSMAVWRLGFSYLLCVRMGWGAVGVWIAMIIDWVCRVTCFVLRFRSGVWKTKYQA